MPSLRELITRVKTIGTNVPITPWPGSVSLLEDFWCYNHRPEDAELSLRKQVKLLQGRYFNLNLIRVGDDLLTDDRGKRINGAAHQVREIYAAYDIGVVRLSHHVVTTENANGHDQIDSDEEASDLTNEWTVHNDGLDVFLVARHWSNEDPEVVTGGLSPKDGTCDKDDAKTTTGLLVSTNNSVRTTGLIMAHELGHYFGLPHKPDKKIGEVEQPDVTAENIKNLMFPLQIGGSELTNNQLADVRDHCFIHGD
jgi:hypothetical protein